MLEQFVQTHAGMCAARKMIDIVRIISKACKAFRRPLVRQGLGRIDGRLQFFARIIACVHMAAQARETGVADKFKAAHGHGGGLIMAV